VEQFVPIIGWLTNPDGSKEYDRQRIIFDALHRRHVEWWRGKTGKRRTNRDSQD